MLFFRHISTGFWGRIVYVIISDWPLILCGYFTGKQKKDSQEWKPPNSLNLLVVAGPGIEPGTSWLWIMRSNQLSYPAIISRLRVQRYSFYLMCQNNCSFFCCFLHGFFISILAPVLQMRNSVPEGVRNRCPWTVGRGDFAIDNIWGWEIVPHGIGRL